MGRVRAIAVPAGSGDLLVFRYGAAVGVLLVQVEVDSCRLGRRLVVRAPSAHSIETARSAASETHLLTVDVLHRCDLPAKAFTATVLATRVREVLDDGRRELTG
jgi:hypothetical protein